ncbi:Gfo/Idh/MocA family oxidoreductase [Mobilitalea sibirica]|uniref:Gfo/Idh/MocA family oxidoreductase n=1 Tax=Mobilitalea sibirica TaxID=1462919 RepID=A0A8J7H4Q2_9FIRM|nr:Gfo/Idh/MocA family oxidoreductase [Mobilitalea sibirica]MBH1942480.1 Gfo/Idh/MocA family oxidoreductase [Mobilitalea sibirica]
MREYKIAMIGLGSIGTRHLLNIDQVLSERNFNFTIDLIRSSVGKPVNEDIIKKINEIYYSYEEVPDDYDVIFITNPTHMHYDTIKKYSSKTKHMFIEKPVFDDNKVSIQDLKLKDGNVYYVACPLRYTDVIQYTKKEIDLSKVYCARVICSSYLPDWRPHMDYRNTYSAHAEQGGGVSIDLIHEWDYLKYLFGQPNKVHNLRGKISDLEINSDDLSLYIAGYEDKMVELHLDYFGRKTMRVIELFTDNDTIKIDLVNSEIQYLCSGRTISFYESRNNYQLKEIAYFFDIIEGKEANHNDIAYALETLKLAKEGRIS